MVGWHPPYGCYAGFLMRALLRNNATMPNIHPSRKVYIGMAVPINAKPILPISRYGSAPQSNGTTRTSCQKRGNLLNARQGFNNRCLDLVCMRVTFWSKNNSKG